MTEGLKTVEHQVSLLPKEQVLDGGCTDVEKALYLMVLTSLALELFSILLSSLAMKSVSSRNRRFISIRN